VTFSAAQAGRPAWQRLAATELTTVLDSHPELPCIAWTAGPAGPVAVGRVSGLAPAGQIRQVSGAWRRAPGLGECRELRGGGDTAWLHAADRSSAVTIRLTAAVPGDDGEAR
jgi:hypothetical protein